MKYKAGLFLLAGLLLILQSNAQDFYWVGFSDKNNTEFSISQPESFLSERAIQRRLNQNIPIDSLDLPVNSNYIDSVLNIGATYVHQSKWLNGITVQTNQHSFKENVSRLPFVKEIQLTKPAIQTKSAINKFIEFKLADPAPIDTSKYGESVFQTGILNGQFLHNQNFKGQGMHIAVLDAGFLNADKYEAFDSLWQNNQILGTRDFVEPDSEIFDTHYHGMSVLSCIGGNVPGRLLGTAPKASFWLLRSEDGSSEFIIEEDNWVAAAEFADSAGVDVINSSLGYYMFDDSAMNHTYSDMDGNTTRVTRAANIAASKGMLVFSSAGNEGNDPWKYIIAPSDGDSVIGVGAVDKNGTPAPFTSFGPASDNETKPNISAIGWKTYLQRSNGSLGYANGTSFSSPVMAGMATCLWQANPTAMAWQVKLALEQSAHLYNNPDSLLGFGIPDMALADQILKSSVAKQNENMGLWLVYPNPVADYLVIEQNGFFDSSETKIDLFSIEGRLIKSWQVNGAAKIILHDFPAQATGLMLLKIETDTRYETIKISKVD